MRKQPETPAETTLRVGVPAVSARRIVNVLQKYSQHDMPAPICKGCNATHHYELKGCVYDFLMDLIGELPPKHLNVIRDKDGDIRFKNESDLKTDE